MGPGHFEGLEETETDEIVKTGASDTEQAPSSRQGWTDPLGAHSQSDVTGAASWLALVTHQKPFQLRRHLAGLI